MDFVSSVCPTKLRALLLEQGEVELVSVYACNGAHFAWFKRKKKAEKVSQPKDLKG